MGEKYIKDFGKDLDKLIKGKKTIKQLEAEQTLWGGIKYEFKNAIKGKKTVEDRKTFEDNDAQKMISEKMNSTIFATNLRVITSSKSPVRSNQILQEVTSLFKQFTETKGNYIKFKEVKGRASHQFFKHYSFRYFDENEIFPLNATELATIYHFPKGVSDRDFSELKQYDSAQAPAPKDLPQEGVFLGQNVYRHVETPIF
jgi:hypothetical protein